MPTYEYECGQCGHAFELFQQMTDPVKRKCPECGQEKEIFSDEFDKEHYCGKCKKKIDFTQCTLSGEAKSAS